ncbi:hypothetical protein [Sulfitobacter phage EE36phi1]|uniref:Uncharacterized protein n=1 Tax=Sulfitobacter phage EE36phi1 TaxID=490913 RepID=C4NTA2_9CAUD|nr:hypothetical protein EE36P1_gp19 [Sulfitobacter phage EE36phi1]ACL81368.1 hypothetical protein [Sulfitobacter phage EE36phi1]
MEKESLMESTLKMVWGKFVQPVKSDEDQFLDDLFAINHLGRW